MTPVSGCINNSANKGPINGDWRTEKWLYCGNYWMPVRCMNGHIYIVAIWQLKHIKTETKWCYIPDDIFKSIFWNEDIWITIKISLTSVPKGLINNIAALVLASLGAGQETSHCLNQWWWVYWCLNTSLNLNELRLFVRDDIRTGR